MFDWFGFEWFSISKRSKRPKTLDQYLWRNDAVKTRIGPSAVSMSSPLMKLPKAIDGYALADQYALINDALRKQVQHMTRENRDLTIARMEKDTKIEEFRQTVEALLTEKNQVEIELEYTTLELAIASSCCDTLSEFFDGAIDFRVVYADEDVSDGPQDGPEYLTASTSVLDDEAKQIPEKTKPFWAR